MNHDSKSSRTSRLLLSLHFASHSWDAPSNAINPQSALGSLEGEVEHGSATPPSVTSLKRPHSTESGWIFPGPGPGPGQEHGYVQWIGSLAVQGKASSTDRTLAQQAANLLFPNDFLDAKSAGLQLYDFRLRISEREARVTSFRPLGHH